jgi:hypothetical protein
VDHKIRYTDQGRRHRRIYPNVLDATSTSFVSIQGIAKLHGLGELGASGTKVPIFVSRGLAFVGFSTFHGKFSLKFTQNAQPFLDVVLIECPNTLLSNLLSTSQRSKFLLSSALIIC